jgi:aspartate 1-decarboxylase
MLKGKIHRAKVTDANVEYEGSISIDSALMEAADILPYESVQVWSVTTGERLDTYVITASARSGHVCINGAAAHRIKKGETVIIASFAWMDEEEIARHAPRIVFVDDANRIRPTEAGATPAPRRASRH